MIGRIQWNARITDVHYSEEESLRTLTLFLYHEHRSITLPYVSEFSLEPGDFVLLSIEPQPRP